MAAPVEQLPDSAPFPLFFLPNFLGILFAWILESCHVESLLQGLLHAKAHRFCLLGWGVFAVANVGSFLGGSVVLARIQYNVKLPNLYATPSDKKGHVQFNTIQRSHQNFVETYAAVVLVVFFTAFVAERPNVAGLMLVWISVGRILYAIGYSKNITDRIGGQLLAIFTMSIGVGYGVLIGCSAFGWDLME